jgi:hypothetical protein
VISKKQTESTMPESIASVTKSVLPWAGAALLLAALVMAIVAVYRVSTWTVPLTASAPTVLAASLRVKAGGVCLAASTGACPAAPCTAPTRQGQGNPMPASTCAFADALLRDATGFNVFTDLGLPTTTALGDLLFQFTVEGGLDAQGSEGAVALYATALPGGDPNAALLALTAAYPSVAVDCRPSGCVSGTAPVSLQLTVDGATLPASGNVFLRLVNVSTQAMTLSPYTIELVAVAKTT